MLVDAITQRGYKTIIDPMLEVVHLPVMLPTNDFDGIFLTSGNAVRALHHGFDRRTHIFTVGQTTRQAAIDTGFSNVDCIGQTVEQAMHFLGSSHNTRCLRLLYPSGVHISAEIALDNGPQIVRVPVYDTQFLPLEKNTIDRLYDGQIDWILLFSRRTAEALAMAIEKLDRKGWVAATCLVCLSARTAGPIAGLPWKQTLIAAEPTAAALIATLPMVTP